MSEQKEDKLSFGIDLAPEEFYFENGNIKFKINPKGHLPEVTDRIIDIVDEYEKAMENNPTSKQKYNAHQKATQGILELALVGFRFDEMKNKIGYGVLTKAAELMKIFLVDNGGKEGSKLMSRILGLAIKSG